MRENGTFAFIMEQKSLEYYTRNNCGLTQIGGLLNERNYAIAMAKGKLIWNQLNVRLFRNKSLKIILFWKPRGICNPDHKPCFISCFLVSGKNIKYKPTKVWKDKVGACIKGRNTRASHGRRGSSLANCKKTCEDETSFNCRSIEHEPNQGLCHWNEDNKASAGRDYQERCHDSRFIYSELVQGWWNFILLT